MPDENGETRRQRHKRFGEPDPPEPHPPDAVDHVWGWFWELSSRRRSGPEALSFAEVGEWQRLMGLQVRREEIELLMQMDDAFVSEVRKEQRLAMERAQDKAKG